MSHVAVTIDGKQFRMACGPGEEQRIRVLATYLDDKIAEMRKGFGEIGDLRLTVMAALTITDELVEVEEKLARLGSENERIRMLENQVQGHDIKSMKERKARDAEIASSINKLAERVERIAGMLGGRDQRE